MLTIYLEICSTVTRMLCSACKYKYIVSDLMQNMKCGRNFTESSLPQLGVCSGKETMFILQLLEHY